MNMKLPMLAAMLSLSGMAMACEYDNQPVRTSYAPEVRDQQVQRDDRDMRDQRDPRPENVADNQGQPPSEQALEPNENGEMHERLGIRQRMVAGKISDTKELSIEGQKEDHVLAKIETMHGNTVVVDLGPRKTMPNVSLNNGAELAVFGTVGRLNGFPLIIAEKAAEIHEIPGRQEEVKAQAENQPGGPAPIPAKSVDPKPNDAR